MPKNYLVAFIFLITLYSCGKKHIPEKTPVQSPTSSTSPKTDSIIVKKKNFTPKKKDIIPNSITVKDEAAKKAIDGRLYYDLLGNRYWKNYKNGKYYLFNQKMYDNPAFKPPK